MFSKANKDGLNLKVNTVSKNVKEGMLVITVEVSDPGEGGRVVVDYSVFEPIPTDLNNAIKQAQLKALSIWYGKASASIEQEPEEAEEPEDLDFEDKPAKGSARKTQTQRSKSKTAARGAKKSTAKKQVEEGEDEDEVDVDLDDLNVDEEEVKEQTKSVVFDKTQMGHKTALRPIVNKILGTDWKDNEEYKLAVSQLMAEINGTLPVMSTDGKVLASFKRYCQAKLKAAV
jgi:hypothetical protein